MLCCLVLFCIASQLCVVDVCMYAVQAKQFSRKAVSASSSVHSEEFTRKIVEFLKVCENIDTSLD